MIIKVKTHPESDVWRFYEASKVMVYKYDTPPINKTHPDLGVEMHSYLARDPGEVSPGAIISFSDEDGDPTEVETDLPCFLLNDQGDTIERLF